MPASSWTTAEPTPEGMFPASSWTTAEPAPALRSASSAPTPPRRGSAHPPSHRRHHRHDQQDGREGQQPPKPPAASGHRGAHPSSRRSVCLHHDSSFPCLGGLPYAKDSGRSIRQRYEQCYEELLLEIFGSFFLFDLRKDEVVASRATPIHQTSWKGFSANFGLRGFLEVRSRGVSTPGSSIPADGVWSPCPRVDARSSRCRPRGGRSS